MSAHSTPYTDNVSPSYDTPLTSGQQFVLLVPTLVLPVLLLVQALASFWFRDTHPQRARSIAGVGLTFLQGVLLVVAFELLTGAFSRF